MLTYIRITMCKFMASIQYHGTQALKYTEFTN
jgi:hypothetical protein